MRFWYGSERDSHTIMTSAQHAVLLAKPILHMIAMKLILTDKTSRKMKKYLLLATYFLLSVKDLEMRHAASYIDACPVILLLVSPGTVSYVLSYQSHFIIAMTKYQTCSDKAIYVTSTQRGRCGEYSMLVYRMLRSIGYEKLRWVVDWADHVWVEVMLGNTTDGTGRWVHCDPCEASVDDPLLYESWGKNQTFIVGFYNPFHNGVFVDGGDYHLPLVEDVTPRYTTDALDVIENRRGIDNDFVAEAIHNVSKSFTEKLLHKLRVKDNIKN